MVQLNIDISDIEPAEGGKREYPQLPEAWYIAYIDDSVMKQTKDNLEGKNNHEYLQLRFDISDWADDKPMPLDVKFIGRKFFDKFNIVNQNSQTVEIAYRELTAVANAVGLNSFIGDTLELHDKPLEIYLAQTTNFKGKPDNEIIAYRACRGSSHAPDKLEKMASMNTASNQESKTEGKQIWDE